MRPRISIWGRVHPSVRRSVGWIVGRSVTRFFWNAENKLSSIWKSLGQSNIDIAEYAWCAGYAKCAKCAIYAICASCASCASCTSWTHHWPAGPCFSYTVTVWKYWFQDFKACHLKMHKKNTLFSNIQLIRKKKVQFKFAISKALYRKFCH